MRIFAPVGPADHDALRSGAARIALETGRLIWGVSDAARAERAEEDVEELEYDALQDAVFSALGQVDPRMRALVLAGDVPDASLADASEDGGAFGLRLAREGALVIASAHATELDAAAAEVDDTDPALLWFDASELPAALDYAEAPLR
ncbi:hypothetical protein I8D64_12430 [Brachybacterium sp. MASK1Z-5]|uniref:Uncharacterized protein n=1 Tax=Brachybacterium halotolerans TaxID=2795215 RepID=A0ABS1BC45_9MICO|nr:hypothetical protein [Brachybacterium halotolerans]MBK0332203.1 hypothetical protein [Brachybacterium halotolerans]